MKKLLLTTAVLLGSGMAFQAHAEMDYDQKSSYGEEKEMKMDIVDTAASKEMFSTLVAAVKAADLVDILKGEGPFTVFAPTNDAFAALPEGTLEDLLKPENKEQLQSILKYHVVAGKIKAADIQEGDTEVETVEGSTIEVTKNADGVTVDGANVVKADVKTSNGVIHVIDEVILP